MAKSEKIIYKEIAFRRYPNSKNQSHRNYYRPHAGHIRAGIGHLHQEIWKDVHGDIPEGYEIHHKDGNFLNNSIENLVCIPRAQHKKHHAETHVTTEAKKAHLDKVRPLTKAWHNSEEGKEWHAQHARDSWKKQEPKEYTCKFCGTPFQSRGRGNAFSKKPKFCSGLCAERERALSGRRLVEKICPFCEKKFMGQAPQKFCSHSCSMSHRWQKGL